MKYWFRRVRLGLLYSWPPFLHNLMVELIKDHSKDIDDLTATRMQLRIAQDEIAKLRRVKPAHGKRDAKGRFTK